VHGGYTVDMFPIEHIRNFCIVAHVDHGKSTLADRLMEITGAFGAGQAHEDQFLDKLQVERDRGITVKAQTVSLVHRYHGVDYLLNLIDTPGHVDFSYEVSRSLLACQGALLLVDAVQGVQAQTVANWKLAIEQGLVVVPALNKIDLPQADPDAACQQVCEACEILDESEVMRLSAKTGLGMEQVLPAIIERIPPPKGRREAPCRLLLFDAFHDPYRGVVALVEVMDGSISRGSTIESYASREKWEVQELGILAPNRRPQQTLYTGQVGYVITGIKDLKAARVGDTWLVAGTRAEVEPLPGFRSAKSMVYASLYPVDSEDFDALAVAMGRLSLNDASVSVVRENSEALGPGFRCGFLGMLHMEVFMQRLDHEHGIAVVTTTPTVPYLLDLGEGPAAAVEISRASDFPLNRRVRAVLEPTVKATIVTPQRYVGKVMQLCLQRRGDMLEHAVLGTIARTHEALSSRASTQEARMVEGLGSSSSDDVDGSEGRGAGDACTNDEGEGRALLQYVLPLAELAGGDMYSALKSCTQGYASFDYEEGEYREADLVRLDILAHGRVVDALARLVHRDEALYVGRAMCTRMKQLLDRQQFEVVIQAMVSGKVVARETLRALRKDVTAKCYGGDISRKRKLLDKQKEGKKRMKRLGGIDVPAHAFPELMKTR